MLAFLNIAYTLQTSQISERKKYTMNSTVEKGFDYSNTSNDSMDNNSSPLEYINIYSNISLFVISIIGIVGNVMVITVIIKDKTMRNSINVILADLALSDLLILLIILVRTPIFNALGQTPPAFLYLDCKYY